MNICLSYHSTTGITNYLNFLERNTQITEKTMSLAFCETLKLTKIVPALLMIQHSQHFSHYSWSCCSHLTQSFHTKVKHRHTCTTLEITQWRFRVTPASNHKLPPITIICLFIVVSAPFPQTIVCVIASGETPGISFLNVFPVTLLVKKKMTTP